ncbi:uncharacterized protein C8A04DRAFT_23904 [Dichotomopilus funicola]|uniref:Uncharacterized protein n=1 Tax=Dichotomopilus funicola TaxID=1934379 RepID=A0AAN6VB23_9PEZI|nr:hypothetical protein C8A04DRAFT_23904 [Dichotomopilus funicola]
MVYSRAGVGSGLGIGAGTRAPFLASQPVVSALEFVPATSAPLPVALGLQARFGAEASRSSRGWRLRPGRLLLVSLVSLVLLLPLLLRQDGQVTRWWKERGEWSPGWKWSHERSSSETEEMDDSDTKSLDFTPSELDALDAIDCRSSPSPEQSELLPLPPTPRHREYQLEQQQAAEVAVEPRPTPTPAARRSARIAARNAAHSPPPPTTRAGAGAGRTRPQRAHPASPQPPVPSTDAAPKKRGGRQPRKKQDGGIQKPTTAPAKREKTARRGKAAAVAVTGDAQAAPATQPRRRPKSRA